MPYGQSIAGGGKMTTYYDGGEAGMYAVIDNSGAYGSITNYARRGMLFTNSRETVVIQDEIAFKGVQSCAWIAHTTGAITVAPDGKTAYVSRELFPHAYACWWEQVDSNHRPHAYQACALTS